MTEEDFDISQRFIRGIASEEEVNLINERMDKEPEFRQSMEELRKSLLLIDLAGLEELKKRTSSIVENQGKTSIIPSSPRKLIALGFIVLLLLISVFLYFRHSTHKTLQNIFDQHFVQYPTPTPNRVENAPGLKPWSLAISAYNRKEFPTATTHFGEVMTAMQGVDVEAEFYMAVSRLASGESTEAATTQLQEISEGNSTYRDQAKWYLALSYLRSRNSSAAQKVFEEIAQSPSHYKQAEATEILKDF